MQPGECFKPLRPYHQTTALCDLLVHLLHQDCHVPGGVQPLHLFQPPFPSLMSTAAILVTRALYCAKDDVPIKIVELMTSLRRCSGYTWEQVASAGVSLLSSVHNSGAAKTKYSSNHYSRIAGGHHLIPKVVEAAIVSLKYNTYEV